MKLTDLDADETLALVALMKTIVLTDRAVSAEEAEALPEIIEEIGEDRYQRSYLVANDRLADETSLKVFLDSVGRPDARKLIYGTIAALAKKDGVAPEERAFLDWLAATWDL